MRRASTWILILALILLALCVLWLLPRLLREEPVDPARGIAASDPVARPGATPSEPLSQSQVAGGRPPPAVPEHPAAPARRAEPDAARPTPPEEVEDRGDRPQPPASLGGRLVDRAGRPVAGAVVLAARAPELGAPIDASQWWITHLPLDVADPCALGAEVPKLSTSDIQGRFLLEGLEPGRARLAVRSGKLAPFDRGDLRLAAGECLELGDLLLEPEAGIYGYLQDEAGRPAADVQIVESDEFTEAALPPLDPSVGVRLAVTDGRGGFQSRPMVFGPWSARALGGAIFADATMRGSTPSEGWNRLETLAQAAWIRGILSTHGTVARGLVVRALPADRARSPVPFACRADGRKGTVMPNGSFRIDGLAPDVLYELRAESLDQRFEDESLWSPPSFAAALDEEARVRWEPDATVSFALVDAHGHALAADCEVELQGALPAITNLGVPTPDHVGLRVLGGVRPLRPFRGASFTAASRGFLPIAQRLEFRAGKDTTLGALPMSPLPSLDVRVVDLATRAAVRGALVTATDPETGRDPSGLPSLAVATDSGGAARVASFAGAGSQIEVSARGYARQRLSGPFGGGFSIPRLEVRLVRGATARIRVVDDAGHALSGERVEWIEGNWSPNEVPHWETSRIADADGLVVFSHLAPGRHAFRVQRWDWNLDGEWTQREFADGEEAEIELQSLARASLAVRISDSGAPLAGAPVVLLRRSSVDSLLRVAEVENPLPPGIDARLDSVGAHTFASLEPGRYVLAFAVPGQRLRGCRGVQVRSGANVLDLPLAQTALSGRVTQGQGTQAGTRPIPGARILLSEPGREQDLRDVVRRGGPGSSLDDLLALGLERAAAVADENGDYRLLGLPIAEAFRILALDDPFGFGMSGPVILREDSGPTGADIDLQAAGALEVRTTSSAPAAPFLLLAVPVDRRGIPRMRRMFPGRSLVLSDLEPGVWHVQLADGSERPRERRKVEIVAGETRSIEWSLP